MISASTRARVLNCETTMCATRLKNSIIRTSLAPLAVHASADGVFSKDNGASLPLAQGGRIQRRQMKLEIGSRDQLSTKSTCCTELAKLHRLQDHETPGTGSRQGSA